MGCVEGKGEEPARLLEQGRQQVLEGRGGGRLQSTLRVIHRNHIPLHPHAFMIKKTNKQTTTKKPTKLAFSHPEDQCHKSLTVCSLGASALDPLSHSTKQHSTQVTWLVSSYRNWPGKTHLRTHR